MYSLNHFATLYLRTVEPEGWDSGESCGTGGGSCGDTKADMFGNSREMGHRRQYCKGWVIMALLRKLQVVELALG